MQVAVIEDDKGVSIERRYITGLDNSELLPWVKIEQLAYHFNFVFTWSSRYNGSLEALTIISA